MSRSNLWSLIEDDDDRRILGALRGEMKEEEPAPVPSATVARQIGGLSRQGKWQAIDDDTRKTVVSALRAGVAPTVFEPEAAFRSDPGDRRAVGMERLFNELLEDKNRVAAEIEAGDPGFRNFERRPLAERREIVRARLQPKFRPAVDDNDLLIPGRRTVEDETQRAFGLTKHDIPLVGSLMRDVDTVVTALVDPEQTAQSSRARISDRLANEADIVRLGMDVLEAQKREYGSTRPARVANIIVNSVPFAAEFALSAGVGTAAQAQGRLARLEQARQAWRKSKTVGNAVRAMAASAGASGEQARQAMNVWRASKGYGTGARAIAAQMRYAALSGARRTNTIFLPDVVASLEQARFGKAVGGGGALDWLPPEDSFAKDLAESWLNTWVEAASEETGAMLGPLLGFIPGVNQLTNYMANGIQSRLPAAVLRAYKSGGRALAGASVGGTLEETFEEEMGQVFRQALQKFGADMGVPEDQWLLTGQDTLDMIAGFGLSINAGRLMAGATSMGYTRLTGARDGLRGKSLDQQIDGLYAMIVNGPAGHSDKHREALAAALDKAQAAKQAGNYRETRRAVNEGYALYDEAFRDGIPGFVGRLAEVIGEVPEGGAPDVENSAALVQKARENIALAQDMAQAGRMESAYDLALLAARQSAGTQLAIDRAAAASGGVQPEVDGVETVVEPAPEGVEPVSGGIETTVGEPPAPALDTAPDLEPAAPPVTAETQTPAETEEQAWDRIEGEVERALARYRAAAEVTPEAANDAIQHPDTAPLPGTNKTAEEVIAETLGEQPQEATHAISEQGAAEVPVQPAPGGRAQVEAGTPAPELEPAAGEEGPGEAGAGEVAARPNPYLSMPLERVRADAEGGVELAKAALGEREEQVARRESTRYYADGASVGSVRESEAGDRQTYATFEEADAVRKQNIKDMRAAKQATDKAAEEADYSRYQGREKMKAENAAFIERAEQAFVERAGGDPTSSERNRIQQGFFKSRRGAWWDKPTAEKDRELAEYLDTIAAPAAPAQKPAELMTPGEWYATPQAQRLVGKSSAREPALAEREHQKAINAAVEQRKPVLAATADEYNTTFPPGYVQDGDRYVFRPEGGEGKAPARQATDALAAEIDAAPSPFASVVGEGVPADLPAGVTAADYEAWVRHQKLLKKLPRNIGRALRTGSASDRTKALAAMEEEARGKVSPAAATALGKWYDAKRNAFIADTGAKTAQETRDRLAKLGVAEGDQVWMQAGMGVPGMSHVIRGTVKIGKHGSPYVAVKNGKTLDLYGNPWQKMEAPSPVAAERERLRKGKEEATVPKVGSQLRDTNTGITYTVGSVVRPKGGRLAWVDAQDRQGNTVRIGADSIGTRYVFPSPPVQPRAEPTTTPASNEATGTTPAATTADTRATTPPLDSETGRGRPSAAEERRRLRKTGPGYTVLRGRVDGWQVIDPDGNLVGAPFGNGKTAEKQARARAAELNAATPTTSASPDQGATQGAAVPPAETGQEQTAPPSPTAPGATALPDVVRTTPRKGTPERTAIDEADNAADAKYEKLDELRRKLNKDLERTRYGTSKRAMLEKRIAKLEAESDAARPARRAANDRASQARREDAAESDNIFVKAKALADLGRITWAEANAAIEAEVGRRGKDMGATPDEITAMQEDARSYTWLSADNAMEILLARARSVKLKADAVAAIRGMALSEHDRDRFIDRVERSSIWPQDIQRQLDLARESAASYTQEQKEAEAKKTTAEAKKAADAKDKAERAKSAIAAANRSRAFTKGWRPGFRGQTHPVDFLGAAINNRTPLPILLTVAVRDGTATATDLDTELSVKGIPLPDGLYRISADGVLMPTDMKAVEEFPASGFVTPDVRVEVAEGRELLATIAAASKMTAGGGKDSSLDAVWLLKADDQTMNVMASDGGIMYSAPVRADMSAVADDWMVGLSPQNVAVLLADRHAPTVTVEYQAEHEEPSRAPRVRFTTPGGVITARPVEHGRIASVAAAMSSLPPKAGFSFDRSAMKKALVSLKKLAATGRNAGNGVLRVSVEGKGADARAVLRIKDAAGKEFSESVPVTVGIPKKPQASVYMSEKKDQPASFDIAYWADAVNAGTSKLASVRNLDLPYKDKDGKDQTAAVWGFDAAREELKEPPDTTPKEGKRWEPPTPKGKPGTPASLLKAVMPAKVTIPVLNTFRVRNGIAEATDLEVHVRVRSDLPGGMYEFRSDKVVPSGVPAEDFPNVEFVGKPEYTLTFKDADGFKRALQAAVAAHSTDPTRHVLNGVAIHFHADGTVNAVATDGRRLHIGTTKGKVKGLSGDTQADGIILPAHAVEILLKSNGPGPVTIRVGKGNLTAGPTEVDDGNVRLYAGQIEGTYPNYRQTIPSGHPLRVMVNRRALGQAVSDLLPSLVNKEGDAPSDIAEVGLSIGPGRFRAFSRSGPPQYHRDINIPVERVVNGAELAPVTAWFNPRFLLDLVEQSDSELVDIGVTDKRTPMTFQNEDETAVGVIMPMRNEAAEYEPLEPEAPATPPEAAAAPVPAPTPAPPSAADALAKAAEALGEAAKLMKGEAAEKAEGEPIRVDTLAGATEQDYRTYYGAPRPGDKDRHAQAIADNMVHMKTKVSEWRAVPIRRMAKTTDAKGNVIEMPEFDFPQGYDAAPTLYPQAGEDGTCAYCGHTPIKNVFWLQHDGNRWTMPCGSECIRHFGGGISGQEMAQDKTNADNAAILRRLDDARRRFNNAFTVMVPAGYGRHEKAWRQTPGVHEMRGRFTELQTKVTEDSGPSALTRWAREHGEEAERLIADEAKMYAAHGRKFDLENARDRVRDLTQRASLHPDKVDRWHQRDLDSAYADIARLEAETGETPAPPLKAQAIPLGFREITKREADRMAKDAGLGVPYRGYAAKMPDGSLLSHSPDGKYLVKDAPAAPQAPTGPATEFAVDDELVMHSPHTGEDSTVSYRGKTGPGKAMVWTGRTQIEVPVEWLSRPGAAAGSATAVTAKAEADRATLDRLMTELDNSGAGRYSPDTTRRLQQIGAIVVPGIRLGEADDAGRLWRMAQKGELSKAEYDRWLENEIYAPGKAPRPEGFVPAQPPAPPAQAAPQETPALARPSLRLTASDRVGPGVAGQVEASRNGSRIATLRKLNEMTGAYPGEDFSRLDPAQIDEVRDYMIGLQRQQAAPIAGEEGEGEEGAEAEAPDTIEDFGEKIGGARKDTAPSVEQEITDDDLSKMALSQIWPKAEVDAIEDPDMAALATALRGEIPDKPRKAYKVAQWVERVKLVRLLMRHANETGFDGLMRRMLEPGYRLEGFVDKVNMLRRLPREHWGRIGKVGNHPDAVRYESAAEGEPGAKKYAFTETWHKTVPAPYAIAEVDGRNVRAPTLDALADAIMARLGVSAEAGAMQFEVRGRRDLTEVFVNKKGDPLYRKLKTFTGPDAFKQASAYIANNHADLVAAWEAVKESDNVKETDVRREANRPRTAKDYRQGRDVTPGMFQEAFGFRGVEFGNWVAQGANQKERQGMLNEAFDALSDLADIIGVPTRALSLNGELGLGFGSRGHGWASAHYEPGKIVINLTKTRGAGTLAHEWFHALDHYFQRQRGAPSMQSREAMFVTYNPETYYQHGPTGHRLSASRFRQVHVNNPSEWTRVEGVRPEVGAALADLVKALNDSPMAKRSSLIDKGRSGGYWSRIIERAARAFENYVIHKMTQKGYQNDYLANVVRIEEFQRDAGRYPYLLDSEVAPVAEAFDGLFSTIKTRETDRGVAMYSPAFPLDTAAPAGDIPTTSKEIVHADQWKEKDPAREDAFRRARARNPRVVLAEARSALDRGRQAARRGDYGGTGAPLAAALDKSTLDSTAYLRPENLDYAARLRSYGYTAVFVRNPGLRPIDGVTLTGGGNNFVLLYTDAARSHELFHILELAGDADALSLRDAVDLSAEEAVGYGEALARRGFSLSSYDLQSEIAAVVFSRGGGFGIPLEQAVRRVGAMGEGRTEGAGARYMPAGQRAAMASAPDSRDAEYAALEARAKAGDKQAEAEAQRMVDQAAKKAGYNVGPVWHGTEEDFTVFDRTKDFGFHLGTREQAQDERFVGRNGGGKTMALYAAIKSPLSLPDLGNWDPDNILDELRRIVKTRDYPQLASTEEIDALEDKLSNYWHARHTTTSRNKIFYAGIKRFLESKGFDGISYGNKYEGVAIERSYAAFRPSQIKSADPFTYDDSGRLIPLSERFNPEKPDIRFSVAEGAAAVTPEQDAAYLAAVEKGDTETAQRMVDEAAKAAGYNVGPVWRGDRTRGVFDIRGNRDGFVWFTENPDYAEAAARGGDVREFRLRADNLLDLTEDDGDPFVYDWADTYRHPDHDAQSLAAAVYDGTLFEKGKWDAQESLLRFAKARGYDAVRFKSNEDNGTDVVVFSSNQAKLANGQTRDDSGRVIPLSERFNPEKPDIRYMPADGGTPAPRYSPLTINRAFVREADKLYRELPATQGRRKKWVEQMAARHGEVVRPYLDFLYSMLQFRRGRGAPIDTPSADKLIASIRDKAADLEAYEIKRQTAEQTALGGTRREQGLQTGWERGRMAGMMRGYQKGMKEGKVAGAAEEREKGRLTATEYSIDKAITRAAKARGLRELDWLASSARHVQSLARVVAKMPTREKAWAEIERATRDMFGPNADNVIRSARHNMDDVMNYLLGEFHDRMRATYASRIQAMYDRFRPRRNVASIPFKALGDTYREQMDAWLERLLPFVDRRRIGRNGNPLINVKAIAPADLQEIYEQAQAIRAGDRLDKQALKQTKREAAENAAVALAGEIGAAHKEKLPQTKGAPNDRGFLREKFVDRFLTLREMALVAFGGEDTLGFRLFYEALRRGSTDAKAMAYRALREMDEFVIRRLSKGKTEAQIQAAIDGMAVGGAAPLDITFAKWRLSQRDITTDVRGTPHVWSKAEIMLLAALMERPEARLKLMENGFYSRTMEGTSSLVIGTDPEATAELMEGLVRDHLTEDERAIAHKMVDIMTAFAPAMNHVTQSLYGQSRATESRYAPMAVDSQERPFMEADDNPLGDSGQWVRTLEGSSFNKFTVAHSKPLVIGNIFEVFDNHVERMSAFANLTLPIRTMITVLQANGGQARIALNEYMGKEFVRRVRDTVQHVAGLASKPRAHASQRLMNLVTSNVSRSLLALNPSPYISNRVGGSIQLAAWLDRVDPKAAADFLQRAMTPLPTAPGMAFGELSAGDRAVIEKLMQNGYLADRFSRDMARVFIPMMSERLNPQHELRARLFLRWVQTQSLQHMKHAEMRNAIQAFRSLKKTGHSDAEAAEILERGYRATQNSSDRLDDSQFMLSLRESGLGGMFPFMSQTLAIRALVVSDIITLRQSKPGSPERAAAIRRLSFSTAGLIAGGILLQQAIGIITSWLTKGGPDDEEEKRKLLADLGFRAAGDLADSAMPMARYVSDIALGAWRGYHRRGEAFIFERPVEQAVGGVANIVRRMLDPDLRVQPRNWYDVVVGSSQVTGLPVGGPKKVADAILNRTEALKPDRTRPGKRSPYTPQKPPGKAKVDRLRMSARKAYRAWRAAGYSQRTAARAELDEALAAYNAAASATGGRRLTEAELAR